MLLLLAAAWLVHRLRVRALERRRRELEAKVAERTEQLEAANATLRELAVVDDLTGIANLRGFREHLHRELRRAARHGGRLALLMIDIDHFKAYNDTFGHPVGNVCLRQVATTLSASLHRAGDMVARFGGEEFAVVLVDIDEEGAALVAERMRSGVEGLGVSHPTTAAGCVTISVGVATTAAGGDAKSLIDRADDALYQAKQSGRNRVARSPRLRLA